MIFFWIEPMEIQNYKRIRNSNTFSKLKSGFRYWVNFSSASRDFRVETFQAHNIKTARVYVADFQECKPWLIFSVAFFDSVHSSPSRGGRISYLR